MTLKGNIKACRLDLSLTLETVAKKIGVSISTLQRYESGVIPNIPSDKIEKLAEVLQTTPARLMGWEDDKKSLITSNMNNGNLIQGNNNLAIGNTELSEVGKSEIETEIINICHKLTIREKMTLLSYAYGLLDKV